MIMITYKGWALAGCAAAAIVQGAAFAQDIEKIDFNIEPQPLPPALQVFGVQSDSEVLFVNDEIRGERTKGLKGTYTRSEGIALLLQDSDVDYRFVDEETLVVGAAFVREAALGAVQLDVISQERAVETAARTEPEGENEVKTIDELRDRRAIEADEEQAKEQRGLVDTIIVEGSRNVGVRRFEDDAQPYIVFNADDIKNSSANNLEEFFRTRLPQNTAARSNAQFNTIDGTIGNTSSVNLRGLGSRQTLILVNGRRAPRVSAQLSSQDDGGFNFQQADINGIPIASIERIEVLPATASGIYGGGATGGVINIITRRDFRGGELNVQYGNTFDTSFSEYRVDASYGFALEGGKTNVLLTGSYSGSGELLVGERDFGARSLALLLENDPDSFFSATTPPLAATPNIRSRFGDDLILDDGTSLGSPVTFVPLGYTGVASDGGQGLVDNAGQYNLTPADDLNGNLRPIRQSPDIYSGAVSIRREFTPDLELFVDASFSRNQGQRLQLTTQAQTFMPGDAPGNPFQNTVSVNYPVIGPGFETRVRQDELSFVGGGAYDLPGDWTISADFNWSRARTEQIGTTPAYNNVFGVLPAINDGTLDVFRDLTTFPIDLSAFELLSPNSIIGPRDSVLRNGAIRISGPAFELPAGSVNISALLETRDEVLKEHYTESYNFFSGVPGELDTFFIPEREQSTDSVYLEALIPLFSKSNSVPFIQALDLQVSGRYDRYSTQSPSNTDEFAVDARGDLPVDPIETNRNKFNSIDYTVGVRYEVSDDLLLRASYGTGFLPPSVGQIFRNEDPTFFVSGFDPKRGGQFFFTQAKVLFGGNPDLTPEESESWSVGGILTPRFLPGFRLSVDYSVVKKADEILFANNQLILDNEDIFPDRVIRKDLTPADMAAGFTGGEILTFDRSALNFANSKSTSLDIQFDQEIISERYGDFRLFAIATHLFSVEQQLTPDSEIVDNVGFDNLPLAWRGNAGLTWNDPSGDWTVGWNAQYYDSYFVYAPTSTEFIIDQAVTQQGAERISSEIYHDFFIRHRLSVFDGQAGGLLENMEFRFGIQNAFNKIPATRPGFSPTDGRFSVYGDNRLRRFTVSLRKSF